MLDLFLLLEPLLFIAFVIRVTVYNYKLNGLPQGTLLLCLTVKTTVPLFSSQRDILTLPTCEWLQKRRN